jgi:group I intron endonuclease
MRELEPVIYKITNLINGKIYVGQSRYNNENYFGSGHNITRAISKYGKENFKKEILEHCTVESLCDREVFWIKELNATDISIGYNLHVGGKDYNFSEQHRKSMSESLTGRKLSDEHKKNIKNGLAYLKGIPRTEEVKLKCSISQKGKKKNKPAWNKGKKGVSDETRKKMSEAKKGFKHSEETKKKIGAAASEMWQDARQNDLDKVLRMSFHVKKEN